MPPQNSFSLMSSCSTPETADYYKHDDSEHKDFFKPLSELEPSVTGDNSSSDKISYPASCPTSVEFQHPPPPPCRPFSAATLSQKR